MRKAIIETLRFAAGAALALFCASSLAFPIFPPIDYSRTVVIEYWNEITGHYFLAADSFEENFVETGGAGPGWHRTGFKFNAYVPNAHRAAGEVCRFYAPSPNTHFYSANPDECRLLQDHPEYGWIAEGTKFEIAVPASGACAVGLVPIHRYY
ncbi:MAG TPA: hypothetical protein VLJ84_04445, partial [Usitatibacter sp.]|nr:hypothetical protein [Usitatibacter sp.]